MKNPLNDKEFLNQLFSLQEREIYARITALTFNEAPIEYIEGRAIDGSVNIDGTSAVRRTCNLTLVAEDINIHEFYWGVKNKFKLEVGLKNEINPYYSDIIWFKQGIYVITQFDTSQDLNKWTIKIQGKDKMCLLNGDISGNLPFNVDFAREEYIDLETKTSTFTDVPIKTIVQKALVEFGKELSHNVIINDIDESGQQMLEYRGTQPLYIAKDLDSGEYKQIFINQDHTVYYELRDVLSQEEYESIPDSSEVYLFLKNIYEPYGDNTYVFNSETANTKITENNELKDNPFQIHMNGTEGWFKGKISDSFNIIYDDLMDDYEFQGGQIPTYIRFNLNDRYKDKLYTVAKIELGDVPGYRLTDLTYVGELKANIGDSLTSVLDKIKNQFTNFEYFYDVDGKFVFQKRREYLSTRWSVDDENNDILYLNAVDSAPSFNFIGNKLISSFQNNPKLTELKNDYTVWGDRDNLAIHMRYAIDVKPTSYKPIRPLKEEHVIIKMKADGTSESTSTFKFYNAPEIEPYNDAGFITNKTGFEVFELLNSPTVQRNGLTFVEYKRIRSILNEIGIDASKLFRQNSVYYFFNENNNFYGPNDHLTLKDLFVELTEGFNIYNSKVEYTFIPLGNGEEEWHIIYPYFAAYPYSTEDVTEIDEEGNEVIIHHKVDWRELIYQMALDFRKLNYTDDYWYYLKQENPWCSDYQTGYEQYYIDLEGFWRLLYNPNPDPVFTDPIDYRVIKAQSELVDNDESNDELDTIYVKNTYEKVKQKDDNLTREVLYKYSAPEDNKINSIYPFVSSNGCKLEFNQTYYIEQIDSPGAMTSYTAQTKGDADYIDLNGVSLNKIQVKDNSVDYTAYKPHIDQAFESITDFDTYYIKNPDYQKLFDIKKTDSNLWKLFYNSDLYSISQYCVECKNSIDKVNADRDNNFYNTNYIAYIENINFAFKTLISLLGKKDFNLLHKAIYEIFRKDIINKYKNDLENSWFNEEKLRTDLLATVKEDGAKDPIPTGVMNKSCLPILLREFWNEIEKIPEPPSNYSDNMSIITAYLTNLNAKLALLLTNIKTQQSQVNSIISKKGELTTSSFDIVKNILIQIEETLTYMTEHGDSYENSQLRLTRGDIENLNNRIASGEVTESNILGELIIIIDSIEIMQKYLDKFKEFIFNSVDSCFIHTIDLLNRIQNLYTIFDPLNQESAVSFKNRIKEAIKYTDDNYTENREDDRDYILLDIKINIDNLTSIADIKAAMDNLKEETSNFQESFIKYDTDNFNYTRSNVLLYENIEYYRASYPFNKDVETGNFWSFDIFDNPKALIFWFDFLDAGSSELSKYSVPAIGTRTKVVNEKNIRIIHHQEIPNIIFYNSANKDFAQFSGYTYVHLPNTCAGLFETSHRGKTAKERVDELLYNHSYCQETISFSAVPIYNLEPNSRIYVKDQQSQINGEYLISKITIPLNYKKMMSINAAKAISSIT